MKNKLIAFLSAGVMLTSPAVLPNVIAAGNTAAEPETVSLPDWVPADEFISAENFYQTYGSVHVQDGLICCVFREQREIVPEGEPQGMLRYELKATKDTAKVIKHDVYNSEDNSFYYEVIVYQPVKQGDFEVTFEDTWNFTGQEPGLKKYTFSIDEALSVTETDLYSWLPDCITEYYDYVTDNQEVSVRGNYVVICLDAHISSSHEWYRTGDEKYDGKVIDYLTESSFAEGDRLYNVIVYQALKDGASRISYDYVLNYNIPYRPEDVEKKVTADCIVMDDAQTILLGDSTRVTLLDYDTGEPINITPKSGVYLAPLADTLIPSNETLPIGSNPCVLREPEELISGSYVLNLPAGYSQPVNKDNVFEDTGYYTVTKYDNGAADAVYRLKKNDPLNSGETRITLYDKDTGELIPSEQLEFHNWSCGTDIAFRRPEVPGGWMYTGPVLVVDSNPCTRKDNLASLYRSADRFKLLCDDEKQITYHDNGSMDIAIKTKLTVSGNINGDGQFTIGDVITLQKWLLNDPDLTIYDWAQGDFDLDNRLTAFDLCLMKQALIDKSKQIVEPDTYGALGRTGMFMVIGDDNNIYSGPGDNYPVIATVQAGNLCYEVGYNKGNDDWVFADVGDKKGWIRVYGKDGEENVLFISPEVDKPAIYLYPEKETDVHVELELTGSDLATTYPKYNNGWDVTASPDGSLLNKADGTHHRYLFWESRNCRTRFDLSKGFCVAGSDTESFLKEKLTYMGLTEEEMNEFIVYWLPRMEHNAYNLIAFQGEAYTDSAKLHITPEPDSILRVFMTYIPLENAVDTEPQQLETFERKGFTVVEWGGSELS